MSYPIFNRSVFAEYFTHDDPQAVAWAENVLEKLVKKGIVADYILRDGDGVESDFEVLYQPVTMFFAYLVRLAREFRDFKQNEYLGRNYLENKGIFMCGDESLDHILYLISNLLRIRAHRGTIKMIEKSIDPNVPHGEMLRLVCWDSNKFFKLGVARPQMNSWNLNNSSPLYRGCTGRYDLNIAYEDTESILDLNKYPLLNNQYIYLSTYQDRECMEIEGVPDGVAAGIGDNAVSKRIVVTPELNFEITFEIAQDVKMENITFGCLAFDINGDPVDLQDIVTGDARNFFFETRSLNQPERFYQIRGILYNKDQYLLDEDEAKLNIGFGRNLRMPENVVSIIPYIVVDNDASDDTDTEDSTVAAEAIVSEFEDRVVADEGTFEGEEAMVELIDDLLEIEENPEDYDGSPSVYIWNVKVTPCSLVYERCYLNNKNFIDVILTNKNARYTNAEVHEILRKFFIPYNTAFNTQFFDSVIDVEAGSFLLLESSDYMLLESDDKILLEQQ